MEDAELGAEQQKLQIELGEIEITIITEVLHNIDDRSRHKTNHECVY